MVTERTTLEIVTDFREGLDYRSLEKIRLEEKKIWVMKNDLIKAVNEIECIIEQLTAETISHEERILKLEKYL